MYVLLSSDSDLYFLGQLIAKAGFRARIATAFSIVIKSMNIYELTPLESGAATHFNVGAEQENFQDRKSDNLVGRQDARVDRRRVRA